MAENGIDEKGANAAASMAGREIGQGYGDCPSLYSTVYSEVKTMMGRFLGANHGQ
jgi:hypothetical protein